MEYRKVERCENEECRLVFLEHEKDYPCCPYCADVRMNKLPKDENKKKIVIAEILKYEDRVEKINRITVLILKLIIFFGLFIALPIFLFLAKGKSLSRSGYDTAPFMFVSIFLILFSMRIAAKRNFLGVFFGEGLRHFDTVLFQIIKILLILAVLYWVHKYMAPWWYDYRIDHYRKWASSRGLKEKIWLNELFLFMLSPYIFVHTVVEILKINSMKKLMQIVRK